MDMQSAANQNSNHAYCMILTKYRIYQGVALYRSLIHNAGISRVFILCMDEETESVLGQMDLQGVTLIPVNALEDQFVLSLKSIRRINEYCWTLKPSFLYFILSNFSNEIQRVTYMDADGCFFADPKVIFESQKDCSVLLSRHNYSRNLKFVEKDAGIYNSGFISFLNDDNGISTLTWWRDQCLHWCYDRVEKGKFGDQKYLETMPHIFKNVCDITTPGVNIGPWNDFSYTPHITDGKVYLDNDPLILYHFAGLRITDAQEILYVLNFNKTLKEPVYNPYINVLKAVICDIQKIDPNFSGLYNRNELNRKKYKKL